MTVMWLWWGEGKIGLSPAQPSSGTWADQGTAPACLPVAEVGPRALRSHLGRGVHMWGVEGALPRIPPPPGPRPHRRPSPPRPPPLPQHHINLYPPHRHAGPPLELAALFSLLFLFFFPSPSSPSAAYQRSLILTPRGGSGWRPPTGGARTWVAVEVGAGATSAPSSPCSTCTISRRKDDEKSFQFLTPRIHLCESILSIEKNTSYTKY